MSEYKVTDTSKSGNKTFYHVVNISAELERCLRSKGFDFCPDCPEYKECNLSKKLYELVKE